MYKTPNYGHGNSNCPVYTAYRAAMVSWEQSCKLVGHLAGVVGIVVLYIIQDTWCFKITVGYNKYSR